jgi:N-acyl-D-aspartate/D-glutamate deacylase
VVFDAASIVDHATYQAPTAPSSGVQFVIVNGMVLVDQGKLKPNTYPGRAL